jgi:nitrogen fixation/metabolism regulation signal transduction histidine kinase
VERKQKLYQCLLKNAKTVRDDQTSFKRLAQSSDPKVRCTTYNGWIKQIKKCCPSFIGQISKPYANEALNLFLHSEVDTAMANNLKTFEHALQRQRPIVKPFSTRIATLVAILVVKVAVLAMVVAVAAAVAVVTVLSATSQLRPPLQVPLRQPPRPANSLFIVFFVVVEFHNFHLEIHSATQVLLER